MGIDISFTEESLKNCKYALCRPYRSKIVGFYSEIPAEGDDDLLPYREIDQRVNMNVLRYEEPTIYEELMKDEPPFVQSEINWPWKRAWFKEYYTDSNKKKLIKPYVEAKPGVMVLAKKMPKQLAGEWIERSGDGNLISAWWELPYEKRGGICKLCPIRPLDEQNCYLRFSNYPGMDSFRQGFLLTALYAATIDQEQLRDAFFSFPYIDRSRGELPIDKIEQLYQMCQGVTVNKGPEEFFNKVFDVLRGSLPDEGKLHSNRIDTMPAPFVDEFLSKFIYRDEPYTQEEIREALPYLQTFEEVADWAVFDTDSKPTRARIIGFRDRLDTLVTALKIGEKYGLQPYVSY